ncbi:FAD-dependent oxidoreductase [Chloroflexota bacterium]
MANKKFERILEPGYIGKVKTRNRMIKTASGSSFIEKDGTCGERIMGWYEAMAKGGVGLIIFETNSIEHPRGNHRPPASGHLDDDKYIPSYTELVRRVHKHGCPIFIQFMHSGPWFAGGQGLDPGDRVAASAIPKDEIPAPFIVPTRELSNEEVKEMIEKFIQAAERAQKCGFDGVEINGSHYHFINSFFSRFFNRRHDEYGCDSMENRARFMVEVIQGVKKRCGQDYPVEVLMNAAEFGLPNGTTFEESKQFAKMIQAAGADALQLRNSGFGPYSGDLHTDRFFYPELPKEIMIPELDWTRHGKGVNVPLATMFKQVVTIPVYVASRLDAELGEQFLREGKLDFVGMTRRLIADPEYPNKIAEDRLDDIQACSGCLYCWENRGSNLPIKCRINASVGREYEYAIKPAEKKKKVMVAGGGPAGMEAARVAALRGHDVTIYDKKPYLGGGLPMAAMVKGTALEDIPAFLRYFRTQLPKLGVKVKLGTEVDRALVDKVKPDVLILAAGGAPSLPKIPGIKSRIVSNLLDMDRLLDIMIKLMGPRLARWASTIWMPIGKKVLIIGGDYHGCELAEYMVKTGRNVTIIDKAEKLGEGMISDDPWRLFRWLDKKGAVMMPGVKYEEINKKGMLVTAKEGEKKHLEAKAVMPALVVTPNDDLLKSLEGSAPEVYVIGDAREPGLTPLAVADGSRIARKI